MFPHNLPSYEEITDFTDGMQLKDILQPPPYDSLRYTGHSDAVQSFFAFLRGDESLDLEEEGDFEEVNSEIRWMEFILYFVIFVIPVALTLVILFVLF